MKVLVDAQLPRKMIPWLGAAGIDARHVMDLAAGNRSTDDQIVLTADLEGRVVVTKDADFVDSHLIQGRPSRLLLVSTGNIQNHELRLIVEPLLQELVQLFNDSKFIELGRSGLAIRG